MGVRRDRHFPYNINIDISHITLKKFIKTITKEIFKQRSIYLMRSIIFFKNQFAPRKYHQDAGMLVGAKENKTLEGTRYSILKKKQGINLFKSLV